MKPTPHLIAAALILSTATLPAADTIELKPKWTVGKKYHLTMETASTTTMSMGGQDMDQKMNMTMDFSNAVSQHEDGQRKRINLHYDRVAMKMDMMGQQIAFDSTKPDDDPQGMGKSFSAIVGKELKMIASAQDEIQDIENFGEFNEALAAGPGAEIAGKFFTKESLTETVGQVTLKSLPGRPIKPGDSWPVNDSMTLPQIGVLSIKGTYTFKGMATRDGASCAEIIMDATMEIAPTPAGAEKDPTSEMMQAMGVTLTHGKITATHWFDNALGMAREVQTKQDMEMTLKSPANPAESIKVPTKQDVTIKLTKVEDLK